MEIRSTNVSSSKKVLNSAKGFFKGRLLASMLVSSLLLCHFRTVHSSFINHHCSSNNRLKNISTNFCCSKDIISSRSRRHLNPDQQQGGRHTTTPNFLTNTHHQCTSSITHSRTISLNMNYKSNNNEKNDDNDMRNINNFFQNNFFNIFGMKNNPIQKGSDEDADYYEDESELYTPIFEMPVKSLKVGGLKLYLSLYFMGQVNTPQKGSWRTSTSEDNNNNNNSPRSIIDLYYKDQTGALTIQLTQQMIQVNRLGSAPSMDYLLQESAILSGLLDELDDISNDKSISDSDRLICLNEPKDAISNVRESLSFG